VVFYGEIITITNYRLRGWITIVDLVGQKSGVDIHPKRWVDNNFWDNEFLGSMDFGTIPTQNIL
jgi:hypothetical protein